MENKAKEKIFLCFQNIAEMRVFIKSWRKEESSEEIYSSIEVEKLGYMTKGSMDITWTHAPFLSF